MPIWGTASLVPREVREGEEVEGAGGGGTAGDAGVPVAVSARCKEARQGKGRDTHTSRSTKTCVPSAVLTHRTSAGNEAEPRASVSPPMPPHRPT
eukprot:1264926-Rhodomonas_salina.1